VKYFLSSKIDTNLNPLVKRILKMKTKKTKLKIILKYNIKMASKEAGHKRLYNNMTKD